MKEHPRPPRTLATWQDILAGGEASHEVALLAPGRRPLSHRTLREQVDRGISMLNDRGFGRRDRIAIAVPNGPDLASAMLTIAAGATAAPLPPDAPPAEIDASLAALQADALLVLREGKSPAIGPARARGMPILELVPGEAAGQFNLEGDGRSRAPSKGPAVPSDLAVVLQTSGTTSTPKYVPLTWTNLLAATRNLVSAFGLTAKDRCLNVVPLHHLQGLVGAILPSLAAGGSIACAPGGQAKEFFGWLESFQATWTTAGPTLLHSIVEEAGRSGRTKSSRPLRFVRSASAPLPLPLLTRVEALFDAPVIEGYGLTEAGTLTSNPIPPRRRKPGSVGVSIGPEFRILDDAGQPVRPGKTGEIVARGDTVTAGYENDDEANRIAFVDGWFRTGDLGYLDPDGYLTLTGRKKELINRGGEKVSPVEVEEALRTYPDVGEVAVFALGDPRLGEDVAAAIVPREGAALEADLLRAFAAERLAPHKVPGRIVMVDEIPKGPTGKVQRLGLAERLGVRATPRKESSRPEYLAPRTDTERTLVELWSNLLAVDRIGVHDSFFDLGGDSLGAAQLMVDIEEAFDRTLPIAELIQAPTVERLARAIEKNEDSKPWTCLVEIQREGSRPPFFCIHGVFGNVLIFRDLARRIGPDQPFYGLQAQGLSGKEPPLTSVEEMADRYLEEIRAFQSEGPYLLGGWSFGTLVALEIARRLRSNGRQVERLIAIDPPSLLDPESPDPQDAPEPLHSETPDPDPLKEARRRLLEAELLARRLGISPRSPEFRFHVRVWEACSRAMRRYTAHPIPDRLQVIWSSRPASHASNRSRKRWSDVAQGGIDSHELNTNHRNLLKGPSLIKVASVIRKWLRAVPSAPGKHDATPSV